MKQKEKSLTSQLKGSQSEMTNEQIKAEILRLKETNEILKAEAKKKQGESG